ncbi:transposase [Pandoraea sputorum]|nr:transposase [Pandoraea sputorum]
MAPTHYAGTPRSIRADDAPSPRRDGCAPQTLHERVKRDQVDHGERDGVTTDERERLKALEREVKELCRANEILKVASAFFAQAELDRHFKP